MTYLVWNILSHVAVLMNIQVSTNAANDSMLDSAIMACKPIESDTMSPTITLEETKLATPNDKPEAKYAVSTIKLYHKYIRY